MNKMLTSFPKHKGFIIDNQFLDNYLVAKLVIISYNIITLTNIKIDKFNYYENFFLQNLIFQFIELTHFYCTAGIILKAQINSAT